MCIYLPLRPYEQDATQGQDLRCVYIYLFVRMSRMRHKVKTSDVYIFTSSSVRAACDIRSRPPMCTYLPLRSYEQDATKGQDLRCVHIYLFVRMSRMRHKVKTCDVYIFTSSSVRAACDTRSRPPMCTYLHLRP